jgi:hypothetical protein
MTVTEFVSWFIFLLFMVGSGIFLGIVALFMMVM